MITAALIRSSVSRRPIRGYDWPDTACVVWAPKEWPDMPTCPRSSLPASGWSAARFQASSWSSTRGTSRTRSWKFSSEAASRIAAIRRPGCSLRHTAVSLPGCCRNTAT